MEGRIKFYNRQKKFGFIDNDDGPDIYFNDTDLPPNIFLRKDQRVSFTVLPCDGGKLRAKKVRPVNQRGSSHELPNFVMQ